MNNRIDIENRYLYTPADIVGVQSRGTLLAIYAIGIKNLS